MKYFNIGNDLDEDSEQGFHEFYSREFTPIFIHYNFKKG